MIFYYLDEYCKLIQHDNDFIHANYVATHLTKIILTWLTFGLHKSQAVLILQWIA